ncbi:MAG: hypothetical protein AAF579_21995 [Cyanobacteria bacterium P01_C01_bin.118]
MHRLLALDYLPAIYSGTTFVLSMVTMAAVSQPEYFNAQYNDAVWQTIVLPNSFEPPGDKSPDRTSGLGSRSHHRQIFEERMA